MPESKVVVSNTKFLGFIFLSRTNVPKEIMGFPDFPFPETDHSFTHHTQVLEYLKNFAREHHLYEKIKV